MGVQRRKWGVLCGALHRRVIHTGKAEPGAVVGHEPGLLPAALAPGAKEPAAAGRVSVSRVSMSRVQV